MRRLIESYKIQARTSFIQDRGSDYKVQIGLAIFIMLCMCVFVISGMA